MKLQNRFDTFETKQNNFALIRMLAATAVCYGHSFALAPGSGQQDLFILKLTDQNFYSGSLAVCIFLFISGVLVSASLLRLQSPLSFTVHRIMRIYPALLASLFISAAAVFTLNPSIERLKELGQWFMVNATGFTNSWSVTGVFDNGTEYSAINGSLWSIPLEVRCYIVLLVAGLLLQKINRQNLFAVHLICLFFSFLSEANLPLIGSNPATLGNAGYHEYVIFFFLGGIAYSLKAGQLSTPLLLAGSVATWLFWLFVIHSQFWIAVSICFFVLLASKSKLLQKIKIKSDISYGMYLYAWPVAQFVHLIDPHLLPLESFFITLLVSIPIAWVSWVTIERPCINLGKKLSSKFPSSLA